MTEFLTETGDIAGEFIKTSVSAGGAMANIVVSALLFVVLVKCFNIISSEEYKG